MLGLPTTLKELNQLLVYELNQIKKVDSPESSLKLETAKSTSNHPNKDTYKKAKDKLKVILFYEVRQLFNTYNVFYNQVMKLDGVSKTIPLRFKKLSTTIKWNLLN